MSSSSPICGLVMLSLSFIREHPDIVREGAPGGTVPLHTKPPPGPGPPPGLFCFGGGEKVPPPPFLLLKGPRPRPQRGAAKFFDRPPLPRPPHQGVFPAVPAEPRRHD